MHPALLEYQMTERQARLGRAVRAGSHSPRDGGPGRRRRGRRQPASLTRSVGLLLISLGRRLAAENLPPTVRVEGS